MPDQYVLLAWMRCGTAESHVTDLAGLGATPIQQRGTVEHMLRQFTEFCHSTSLKPCVRPTFFGTVFLLFVPSANPTNVAIRSPLPSGIDRRVIPFGGPGCQSGWDKQDQRSSRCPELD